MNLDYFAQAMLSNVELCSKAKVVPESTSHERHEFMHSCSLFELLCTTFACMNAIVGVCMVMKHDGMAISGWLSWAFDGAETPYHLDLVFT